MKLTRILCFSISLFFLFSVSNAKAELSKYVVSRIATGNSETKCAKVFSLNDILKVNRFSFNVITCFNPVKKYSDFIVFSKSKAFKVGEGKGTLKITFK